MNKQITRREFLTICRNITGNAYVVDSHFATPFLISKPPLCGL